MCGYFGNLHECPAVITLLNQLSIPLPYPQQRAYQRRYFSGFIDQQGMSDALWWYSLHSQNGELKPNEKLTSFNARDLSKPLWRNAIVERRGLVFATELGESMGNNRYLMRSEEGFALGCVYKDWVDSQGTLLRSFAVITRPPHERFSRYHDKSIPMFLPLEINALNDWLTPGMRPSVQEMLEQPQLTTNLQVTPVKTYKNAENLGATELLAKD